MSLPTVIESPLGRIDVSNVNLKCRCGGDKVYSGCIKISYPGICDWKCDKCGEKGAHYSFFPEWYTYLPIALRKIVPHEIYYNVMFESYADRVKSPNAKALVEAEEEEWRMLMATANRPKVRVDRDAGNPIQPG
jgi:hypothetical protein